MAHYAYLQNQIVVDVIVGKDETELIDGLDPEIYYAQGTPYTVKRTSYNGKIRYNYAAIGYVYDSIRDAFIPPKCHDEATVNEATCLWDCSNADHIPQV
ncbi:hypothetical protein UFOVP1145_10 [uncultured Caudovirales phage]|uniref:Uncharacterized protein n=1 Tax=uncultured Caudovirales phage TaxID=2100421 RepID=A0A6J5R440_9CAUD|nr:hypothetical protein UFOVP1145_10 [uncultured Caudovirales phage]